MKKRVFIAHRIAGDREANIESAKCWVRWAALCRNVNPIAPYLTLLQVLDETHEEERKIGVELGSEIIEVCHELWICGPRPNPDSYVWEEVISAKAYEVRVIDFTNLILPLSYRPVYEGD